MEIALYYIIPFLVVLGALIFFHELGHFLMAKAFNVKVETFSLGFGPKILKKRWGETEYAISALPLGGYVKMLGEDPGEQNIPYEELQRSFMQQPLKKRLAIVAAGPIFNLLLAIPLFFLSNLITGAQILLPEVGSVTEGSPAERAGLKAGDLILSIDGKEIKSWEELRETIASSTKGSLSIVVKRQGEVMRFEVTPEVKKVKNLFGEEKEQKVIGIAASQKYKRLEMGVLDSFIGAFKRTYEVIYLTIYTLIKLIERVLPLSSIGGPLMIGQMTGQIAQENWAYLFPFMAVISVNLAILNLLPLPVLDGGLILMFLVEFVIRRPLSIKVKEVVQKVGVAFLVLVMILVTWNDLMRIEVVKGLVKRFLE